MPTEVDARAFATVPERPSFGRRRLVRDVLLLWVLSRVVSTAILLLVAHVARPGSRIGAHAGLLQVLTAWDGQWYQLIATTGYPARLPTDAAGVAQSAWAFLPLYPALSSAVVLGRTGLWPLGAVSVSLVSGAVAAVLLALLVQPSAGGRGARIAAAAFLLSPAAFLLEAAYAEALSLALLFAVLLLLDRRRPLLALGPVLLLAFTRPGLQAVALVVVLHALGRVVGARRRGERLPARETASLAVLAVVSVAAGWFWPWTAAVVTGRPDAYVQVEAAWRSLWTGTRALGVGIGWQTMAGFFFGGAGPLALGALATAGTALLLGRPGRLAGSTSRLWALSWSVYLALVVLPTSSLVRFLMPLAPMGAALSALRTRAVVAVLVVSVALQGIWAFCVYGYWSAWWNVP